MRPKTGPRVRFQSHERKFEAILLAALFVGLWLGHERLSRVGDGTVAAAYLLGLAAIRFGLFYMRDEPAVLFGLKTAQLIGLGIAVVAVVLFIAARQARSTPGPSIAMEASQS